MKKKIEYRLTHHALKTKIFIAFEKLLRQRIYEWKSAGEQGRSINQFSDNIRRDLKTVLRKTTD